MIDSTKLFNWALKTAAALVLGYKSQAQQQVRTLDQKDVALVNLRQKDGAVIVIVGARGLGKTELAYRLAEFLDKPAFAVSPQQVPHPNFIQRISLDGIDEKLIPDSTIIFDDVPAYMSNRDYSEGLVKAVEKLVPMVRHKRLHLIFATQSSGIADKHIFDADAVFVKPGNILFEDLERPAVKRLYQLANQYFDGKDDEWVKRHAFLATREWSGLIEVKKVS